MTELAEQLTDLKRRLIAAADAAPDEPALENVRIAYLGRNGEVTTVRRTIGSLPPQRTSQRR